MVQLERGVLPRRVSHRVNVNVVSLRTIELHACPAVGEVGENGEPFASVVRPVGIGERVVAHQRIGIVVRPLARVSLQPDLHIRRAALVIKQVRRERVVELEGIPRRARRGRRCGAGIGADVQVEAGASGAGALDVHVDRVGKSQVDENTGGERKQNGRRMECS